jgi:hypothetical protein
MGMKIQFLVIGAPSLESSRFAHETQRWRAFSKALRFTGSPTGSLRPAGNCVEEARSGSYRLFAGLFEDGVILFGDSVLDFVLNATEHQLLKLRKVYPESVVIACGVDEGTGSVFYLIADTRIRRKFILLNGVVTDNVGELTIEELQAGMTADKLQDAFGISGADLLIELARRVVDPDQLFGFSVMLEQFK